jgi:hypothetical protein
VVHEKPKQSDIGEGPTKLCILGIVSRNSPTGSTVSGLMYLFGRYLRSQGQDRVGRFLAELEHRELIKKIDMPRATSPKNTKGYVITDEGKRCLEQYFSIEFREIRDLSQPLKGKAFDDIKRFWHEYGKEY